MMAGFMVLSVKVVIMHWIAQFFWLIFQVRFHCTVDTFVSFYFQYAVLYIFGKLIRVANDESESLQNGETDTFSASLRLS